jgi:RHS repeat-associated protein
MLQNTAVSGSYLAGVRTYDSTVGRFTSSDPISHRVGQPFETPYAYAGNTPTTYTDRAGLCAISPWADDSCLSAAAAAVPGGDALDNALTGAVAVGDVLTMGGSQTVRHALGLGGAVNECSSAYQTTSTVATVATIALGGAGAARFALAKAAQLPGLAARAATTIPKAIATARAGTTLTRATTATRVWAAGRAEKVKSATASLGARVRLADDTGAISLAARPGAAADSVTDGVALSLRYKSEWNAAQRAAADAKVGALNTAAETGALRVTQVERAGTTAASRYRRAGGTIPDGSDVDHTIDLQLGGIDDIANLSPLDMSVNRSLGAQIMWRLREVEPGLRVLGVTIS